MSAALIYIVKSTYIHYTTAARAFKFKCFAIYLSTIELTVRIRETMTVNLFSVCFSSRSHARKSFISSNMSPTLPQRSSSPHGIGMYKLYFLLYDCLLLITARRT